jgi:hypothetical protein
MMVNSLLPVTEELNTEHDAEETFEEKTAEIVHSSRVTFDELRVGMDLDSSRPGSVHDGSSTHQDTGHESTSSDHREDSSLVAYAAQKENRNVFRSKILVFTVLLIAAVLVGFFTYYFLNQEEVNDFHAQVCTADKLIVMLVITCEKIHELEKFMNTFTRIPFPHFDYTSHSTVTFNIRSSCLQTPMLKNT